jgi:4-hydroxy-2-oxoheptanedioate aldolase
MKNPVNAFKQALREGRPQIGLWVALADAYVAELLANAGYDWILIDGEHAPNDVRSVLSQLQAVAPYPVSPLVRPPRGSVDLIKQYLDIGVQTLLIPMVETAEQAARMVAAVRYPPRGMRGVGNTLARASRWNQVDDYLRQADAEICVLLQVESVKGMQNLADIASVEGVDGIFFGPGDLSASMGCLGRPDDPGVLLAIREGIETVKRTGKAAGILCTDKPRAQQYLNMGVLYVAVGSDTTLLLRAAKDLLAFFKGAKDTGPGSSTY